MFPQLWTCDGGWQIPELQRRGFHTHQLWFSSSTLHLCFHKHCLFTAAQSIIKTDFPKKWEAREDSKQTEMQRQKTTIGSIGSQWDNNSADNNGFLQEFGPSQSEESLWGEERWNDDVHSSGKVGKVLSHQTGKSMCSKIIEEEEHAGQTRKRNNWNYLHEMKSHLAEM